MIAVTKSRFPRRLAMVALSSGLMAMLPWSASATVQINLAAGYLRGANGTTALTAAPSSTSTAGSLLLLVAANQSTNTFNNALSSGQYVAGGDTILASFAFNNFNGGPGGTGNNGQTTGNSLNFTLPATVTAGSTLVELVWFPTITLTQYNAGTTTSNGTTYGAYYPGLYPAVNGSSLAPDGGNNWVVPPDNSAGYNLYFFTHESGLTSVNRPEAEGYANLVVSVPEPSTGILSGLALVIAASVSRISRRLSVG